MIVLDQKGERGRIDLLRFSPDGNSLLTPLRTGLRIWDGLPTPGPPRVIPDLIRSHPEPMHAQFTPNGRTVLANSTPLAICDLEAGTVRRVELWARGAFDSCVFGLTPDGAYFVAAQYNYGSPAGWMSCRPLHNPTAENAVWYRELARPVRTHPLFRSDGRFVALDSALWEHDEYRVIVCSTRTGKELSAWDIGKPVGLRALSPGDELVAGLRARRVMIYPADDFTRPLVTLQNENPREFTDVAFHPSGQYLAATSNDETVRLYDTATWEPTKTYTWKEGRMRSIAFSPDGSLAAAGTDTGRVVLWDVDL